MNNPFPSPVTDDEKEIIDVSLKPSQVEKEWDMAKQTEISMVTVLTERSCTEFFEPFKKSQIED